MCGENTTQVSAVEKISHVLFVNLLLLPWNKKTKYNDNTVKPVGVQQKKSHENVVISKYSSYYYSYGLYCILRKLTKSFGHPRHYRAPS